jgi:hypothetical protein
MANGRSQSEKGEKSTDNAGFSAKIDALAP